MSSRKSEFRRSFTCYLSRSYCSRSDLGSVGVEVWTATTVQVGSLGACTNRTEGRHCSTASRWGMASEPPLPCPPFSSPLPGEPGLQLRHGGRHGWSCLSFHFFFLPGLKNPRGIDCVCVCATISCRYSSPKVGSGSLGFRETRRETTCKDQPLGFVAQFCPTSRKRLKHHHQPAALEREPTRKKRNLWGEGEEPRGKHQFLKRTSLALAQE